MESDQHIMSLQRMSQSFKHAGLEAENPEKLGVVDLVYFSAPYGNPRPLGGAKWRMTCRAGMPEDYPGLVYL
jgi:hypothetical protein